ncbi:tRNA-binding protein [Melia azedarach]|uniref:tRNA-binding protein n=1 Tax=Melia azedarach TaxID=155640 RepID=A0ACC1Y950_MELAZ|nr:tRNA-binding protein [Melia azedarach]
MAAVGSKNLTRKQLIASSLCKHFSADPNNILSNAAEKDVKTLYSDILTSSGKGSAPVHNDEVMKWIKFAESVPADSKACFDIFIKLNEELAQKSVLLGNGFRISEADVIVFSALHSFVIGLSNSDLEKLPHVMRWMDYIQNKEDLGELFGRISLEKAEFDPPLHGAKTAARVEADSNAKKTGQSTKIADKSAANLNIKGRESKKTDVGEKGAALEKKKSMETEAVGKDKKKKAAGDQEASQQKKKSSETEAAEKDKELSVSLLNIQVGLIRKAWKHPSADSLLVEEIDVGEAKLRQVVSGLAKYCNADELTNRRVVLITNVKPGKLRDVMSEGLVLCASNEDHTLVEPLLPPEGAKIGERVSFSGIDGKPEEVLNPKKKQLEKITPNLFTDDKGVATFKGIPFMTSAGPCTSSIPKASIK